MGVTTPGSNFHLLTTDSGEAQSCCLPLSDDSVTLHLADTLSSQPPSLYLPTECFKSPTSASLIKPYASFQPSRALGAAASASSHTGPVASMQCRAVIARLGKSFLADEGRGHPARGGASCQGFCNPAHSDRTTSQREPERISLLCGRQLKVLELGAPPTRQSEGFLKVQGGAR